MEFTDEQSAALEGALAEAFEKAGLVVTRALTEPKDPWPGRAFARGLAVQSPDVWGDPDELFPEGDDE